MNKDMKNINELNRYISLRNFDTFLYIIRKWIDIDDIDFDTLYVALDVLIDNVPSNDPTIKDLQDIGKILWDYLDVNGYINNTYVKKYVNQLNNKSANFLIIN